MPPTRKPVASTGAWISRIAAGVILGLTLALACSAVYARLATGTEPAIARQLAMWTVMPVWLTALASAFAFRTPARTWAWLGSANAVVLVVLALIRLL